MQIAEVKERAEKICDNMEQVIVGKRMQIKYVLAAFLAGGNVLLEKRCCQKVWQLLLIWSLDESSLPRIYCHRM